MFSSQLNKQIHSCQKGFTLIELLIVVAILGILAGVCIPNVTQFMVSGTIKAASNELENVKTASVAYYADKNIWPTDSSELSALLNGTPNALYSFDPNTGFVISAADISWSGIYWVSPTGPLYSQHGEWHR